MISESSAEDSQEEQWLGKEFKTMHWMNQLHSFDEETMIRLMGRDLCLYLKFLKYQAVQFFVLFLLSFATLIPLYWSGSDATVYLDTVIENN